MTNRDKTITCRKCFHLRVLAVLLWTSVLVVASLMPVGNSLFYFNGQDKVLHFFAYMFTALLACRMLQVFNFTKSKIVYISAFYSIIIGALLELSQMSMNTSRQGEWLDFLANLSGALCGCAIFCLYRKLFSGAT